MSAFTIALAQFRHPQDGDVPRHAAEFFQRAEERGADLLVFPECLMTGCAMGTEEFIEAAEPLDGPFASAMAGLAAKHGMWTVFTMNERAGGASGPGGSPTATALPYNTAVVVDAAGAVRGVYRKVHLFDAGSERESARMQAGGRLFEPIDTPFCRLGLGICYDLRFPEVARAAALGGCELMVFPAAWVAGERKAAQWKALVGARAIENEMFVAGCCSVDPGRAGLSCLVDPFGEGVFASSEDAEELLVCRVDLGHIAAACAAIPVLEHRRPEVDRL